MHNKEYALKLVQDKINGLNNYSYSQIIPNHHLRHHHINLYRKFLL